MPIKAVIFDFDGVILETEGPAHQSWAEFYQELGLTLTMETWSQCIGAGVHVFDPLADIEKQVGRLKDRDQFALRRLQRETELISAKTVLPGVTDILQDAKQLGLHVGLASSSSCNWVVGHLERLGLLDFFAVIRAADDVQRTKPDPELYLLTLHALGVTANQAFAVEDSPNGISAAKRAGLFCVVVPNQLTLSLPLDHADMQIESLSTISLQNLICEIERRQNGKQ